MTQDKYGKIVVAVAGLAALVFGFDESSQLVQAAVAFATAVGVYFFPK
jgi:hypothetical protein